MNNHHSFLSRDMNQILHTLNENATHIPYWFKHLNSCNMCLCYGRIQLLSFNPMAVSHYFVPSYFENNIWIFNVFTHSSHYPNSYPLSYGLDLLGEHRSQYLSRFVLENVSKTNFLQLEYWDGFKELEGWKEMDESTGLLRDYTKVIKSTNSNDQNDLVNFEEEFKKSDNEFKQLLNTNSFDTLKSQWYPSITS